MSSARASVSPVSTPPRTTRPINPTQDVAASSSPSSATISESGISTSFHQTESLAVRAHASAEFHSTRKIAIWSDPALLTCFDAADRRLYDLWVPKA